MVWRVEFRHGLIRALALVLWDCSWFCLFVVLILYQLAFTLKMAKWERPVIAFYLPNTPSKLRESGCQSSQGALHWLVHFWTSPWGQGDTVLGGLGLGVLTNHFNMGTGDPDWLKWARVSLELPWGKVHLLQVYALCGGKGVGTLLVTPPFTFSMWT